MVSVDVKHHVHLPPRRAPATQGGGQSVTQVPVGQPHEEGVERGQDEVDGAADPGGDAAARGHPSGPEGLNHHQRQHGQHEAGDGEGHQQGRLRPSAQRDLSSCCRGGGSGGGGGGCRHC